MQPERNPRRGRHRALFLVISLILPAACAFRQDAREAGISAAAAVPAALRPCALGQQWVYQVRNVFSGAIVDQLTETVVATSPLIRIARTSAAHGELPEEIQSSWGMLVQDPHWPLMVEFRTPIPAWPATGRGPHHYVDHYRTSEKGAYSLWWDQIQRPLGQEAIKVPAGQFQTLHFANSIAFLSPESFNRIDNTRDESIWLSAQIGRWVQRRSCGTYYIEGRGGRALEDCLQWELLSWK